MDPNQLSNELRRIANAIDNSSNPNRNMVVSDIKNLISKISSSHSYVGREAIHVANNPIAILATISRACRLIETNKYSAEKMLPIIYQSSRSLARLAAKPRGCFATDRSIDRSVV